MTFTSDALVARHLASALAGAGFEVGSFRPVERTLLDTFDGRLHGAGLRLEVRAGAALQLVVRGAGPAPAHVTIQAMPALAADLPAGPLRARLAPILEVRALRPILRVTSLQASAVRRNESGKVIAAIDIYDSPMLDGGDRLPVPCAADAVGFQGYPKALRQAEELLGSVGLRRQDGDLFDVAAQSVGRDLRGFADSPTVALDPAEPASDGYRRVLANLAATIEANWQGTVDDIDPEFLHDLRVAVRRTRSVLSHGKGVLQSEGRDHFRAEFRWLGTVTSPLRDLDVYVIEWPGYVAPLDPESAAALAPVVDHIARRRAEEHATLVAHLGSARYRGIMTAWGAWLDVSVSEKAPPGRKPSRKAARQLGPAVRARIVEAQAMLLSRGRGIGPETPAEELHELRKDAKRLRYLLECFGGMLPASARKPFVQRLKAVQDNLGEHQDTEVHTTQLKTMSQELHGAPGVTADTLLAMGRLAEVFDRRRQQARDEFAERFTGYDTKQTARALRDLLDSAGT